MSDAVVRGALAPSRRVFDLDGGRLALDFANTLDNRPTERRTDLLESYPDLVAWGAQAGVLGAGQARVLLREAAAHPREAAAVLKRAIQVREALYDVASALAAGREAPAEQLLVLEEAARDAAAHARLEPAGKTLRWTWEATPALDRVLWPVARDAADLLTSPDVSRVRECASDSCAWLFLDESRNASRIWCSMRSCGNRAKAKRHYARTKGAG